MENNINNELEQMREQMQVLREKLDKQEIINDKMIRRSINAKMSWIKKYVYFEFFLLPVIALAWLGIKYIFDLSWWNYAFIIVISTVDVIWDYRINVASLKADEVQTNSLTSTMQKLLEMKQIRAKSFYIMFPALCVWLIWVGIEMWQNLRYVVNLDDFRAGMAYGGFVGLIIGGILGIIFAFRIYFKMQRTNDEVIEQIKEITNEE